ncbi:hypothetical protein DH2020_034581 [Rehmannia glutinosa]|uniref:Retrotransposon Copia-like N-terminal domain-containing protein n=1 Tax=Rehmannia glutinosa TaxID=99300 RepID=A0ABR0VBS7_REHGL
MAGGGDDKNKKIDLTSPYSLGSQDNPGNVITNIQLRGENYDEWARAIRLSLKARRKFDFVEGTVTKPNGTEKLDDWSVVHSMLVSWIMNTIEPTLRSTIAYYEDDAALWKDLKERFCVVNGPRIQQLKSAFGDCKQAKNEPVVNYFGCLKQIWDELATYVILPGCECGACTCNLGAKFAKIQEEDCMHRFLMGLDGAYGAVRSNLLSLDPLPSINRAYQAVIQEECLRGGSFSTVRDERDGVMNFKVQTDYKGKNKVSNQENFCNHYNREGHDENGCFQLHGFPEWWRDRPSRGAWTWTWCWPRRGMWDFFDFGSWQGHATASARPCYHKRTWKQCTNTNRCDLAQQSTSEASGLAGLTSSQWQNLLETLNAPKKSSDRLHDPIIGSDDFIEFSRIIENKDDGELVELCGGTPPVVEEQPTRNRIISTVKLATTVKLVLSSILELHLPLRSTPKESEFLPNYCLQPRAAVFTNVKS